MSPEEEALATVRLRAWIGEVLLDGWTPRAREVATHLGWTLPDELEVRHTHVMRCVPPYESVFTSYEGQLGSTHYPVVRSDVEPDHAGLIAAGGWPLPGWIRVWAAAVEREGIQELTDLARLLAELAEPAALPAEEDVLADDRGLRDIVRYLLAPARCGIWLSTDGIQRLALQADVRCGFGRRFQMLEASLKGAVDQHTLPNWCQAVQTELECWPATDAHATTRNLLDALRTHALRTART